MSVPVMKVPVRKKSPYYEVLIDRGLEVALQLAS